MTEGETLFFCISENVIVKFLSLAAANADFFQGPISVVDCGVATLWLGHPSATQNMIISCLNTVSSEGTFCTDSKFNNL